MRPSVSPFRSPEGVGLEAHPGTAGAVEAPGAGAGARGGAVRARSGEDVRERATSVPHGDKGSGEREVGDPYSGDGFGDGEGEGEGEEDGEAEADDWLPRRGGRTERVLLGAPIKPRSMAERRRRERIR